LYFLIFSFIIITVLIVTFQIYSEKKVLLFFKKNNNSTIFDKKDIINEFSIPLIFIGCLPITGRYSCCILFKKDFTCTVFKNFICLTLFDNENNKYSITIPKNNIKLKWDILAGDLIKINLDNTSITFRIFSRKHYFL